MKKRKDRREHTDAVREKFEQEEREKARQLQEYLRDKGIEE
jgi:hypothetical protein